MSIDPLWHFCIASLNSVKPDNFNRLDLTFCWMKRECEIDRIGFVCERPWFCVLSTLEVKYVE